MNATRKTSMMASGALTGAAIAGALLAAPLAPACVEADNADCRDRIAVMTLGDFQDLQAPPKLMFHRGGEWSAFDDTHLLHTAMFGGAVPPGWITMAHPAGDTTIQSFSESHTIEVTIEDGKTTIKVDGEEVPEEQLKRVGNQIIILDKDGNQIKTLMIGGADMFRGPGHGFWYGGDWDDESLKFVEEPQPKVMLGVNLDEPGSALCYHLGLEPGTTTLIPSLYKGLPAHEAGLRPYDVIVGIDGERPADPASLRKALAEKEPGDVIRLTVIQEGEKRKVKVALAEYDAEVMAGGELVGEAPHMDISAPFTSSWFSRDGNIWLDRRNLRDFFIDEHERVFEVPKLQEQLFQRMREPARDDDELDSRLEKLNKRLAELEKMLDALLEEAEHSHR